MKKKLQCLCALIILCLVSLIAMIYRGKTQVELSIDESSNLSLTVNSAGGKKVLYPYENPLDGKSYFFLPSYAHGHTIHVRRSGDYKITVEGERLGIGRTFLWEDDKSYPITVTNRAGSSLQEYSVVFMRSENIPAVFIETDSGSMEYLHSDKNNMEPGFISIVEANGNIEYAGVLERISGRGNTSWQVEKKPYIIKLNAPKALLGMDSGKRWYLLPIWRESNRMNTKVALDIAAELGLAYTPQCTWIDLYLNGEYNGNYLLCESMTVESGRIEIANLEKENKINNPDIESAVAFEEEFYKGYELKNGGGNTNGGYLVEKDNPIYYQSEPSGFITASGNCFSLKSPSYASREQVEYIKNYFQAIEDMIAGGNPDYEHYIDLKSFSARFLVDEISLNFDANVTSMFFYKNKDSDLLYAGPVWDYDSSMGWGKVGPFSDYEESTLNNIRDDDLKWYQLLYFLNEEFYRQVVSDYEKLLPYFETLLDSTIDEYADTVRASSLMDAVRWQAASDDMQGHYVDFDNNVRYLKFFLAKRLNYLCEKWQIPYQEFATESNGLTHTVTFICDNDMIETKYVTDADILTELPYLDESLYDGWYYGTIKYNGKIPIYEDCTLYAR